MVKDFIEQNHVVKGYQNWREVTGCWLKCKHRHRLQAELKNLGITSRMNLQHKTTIEVKHEKQAIQANPAQE